MELPPVLQERFPSDNGFDLELNLTPDLSCFAGHFEDAPVLAGVVQVGWVIAFAEQKLQRRWQFRGLQSAKFQRLVLPPVTLRLEVEYLPRRQMLKFKYSDANGAYSTGGVLVDPRPE